VGAVLAGPVGLARPAAGQAYGPQPVGITCSLTVGLPLRLSCAVNGFGSGVTVVIRIFSTPRVLATVVTDGAGRAAVEVDLPADLEPGDHRVEAEGRRDDGQVVAASTMVNIGSPFSVERQLASLGAGAGGAEAAPLPRTGSSPLPLAGLGSMLVAVGALAVLAARQRRRRPAAQPPGAG